MKKNEIKSLSDKEHALLRPGLYIGSPKPVTKKLFIYNHNKNIFEFKEVTYIPALLKIIREVIDNCIDEGLRTNWKFANKLKINIDENGFISIEDNGRGIPFSKTGKITSAELAWCNLRSGSNFDDDDDSTTLGQNGVGVSLTHIYSKSFLGETCDGNKKVSISSSNNMENKNVKITNGTKKFTRVSFLPDYSRFDISNLDETHRNMLFSDLYTLTQIYPKLNIIYNKNILKNLLFKDYMKIFNNEFEIIETDGLKIGIFPNNYDDFNFYHNINGLNVIDGGNPLNWVVNSTFKPLVSKLSKKYKNIKIGDIKNKVSMVVLFSKMSNPRFNSQTKENCINTYTDFKKDIGNIDFNKFAENRLYKNKSLITPIIEIFKIKQEYEERKLLKDLKPEMKKRVVIEKYLPASKENKYLVLAEGNSALGGVSAVLGRKEYGYFPLKGKPLNVLEVKSSKIRSSEIIRDILQILKLDITNPNKQKLTYEKILIATDADVDGSHISGLLILFFQKFAPYIIKEGRLCLFKTPLVVSKRKNKIENLFFDLREYNQYKIDNKDKLKGLDFSYYKGLGKWTKEKLQALIKEYSINKFIYTLEGDENLNKLLDLWFLKETSDLRKEQIKDNNFDIEGV